MKVYSRFRICKKWVRKISAAALVAVLSITFILPGRAVYGAAPTVTTDEAVYVNLDYYGAIKDVSVVKSCSLNGISQFQDYGVYEAVTNMSGYETPKLNAEGVYWDLGKASNRQRFYYNCKLKNDAIVLPWTIDVDYKLNGVPYEAAQLAGAAGLVEINVHVQPNLKARDYYRNNMLLQVAAYINTEDAYSLDAPGAQQQSLGTYKAVLFAALPGEEDTFTIRIGTDCFETQGITMMMIPGTLKQLEKIKEIKEAKDTIHDSANAIYTSMNELLYTVESMKEGLNDLKQGSLEMEKARQTFSSGKDQMYDYGDTVLEDMTNVNLQLKRMIPYFKTGRKMTRDLNNDIGTLVNTMQEIQGPMKDMNGSLNDTIDDLEALQDMVGQLNSQIESSLSQLGQAAQAGLATPYEALQLKGRAGMAATLGEYSGHIDSLLREISDMADTGAEITDIARELADEAEDLDDTLDKYQDDILDLLEDCQTLTELMSSNIDSTYSFLTYSKELLKLSGEQMDSAAASSLQGLTSVLDKSILGLSTVTSMRAANDTIKKTIDDEFAKFEEENNFLNLDATAELISFTSDKNPPPTSVQIVLRTEEISLDDGNNNNEDLETPKQDTGFWVRLKNLFNKLLQFWPF
jgi:uncharacterized coiled-coil DUF342 family protein